MGVQTPDRKLSPSQMYGVPIYDKPHTLKHYALDHFRSPLSSPRSSLNGTLLRSSSPSMSSMWRHIRGPIAQPLLRRLLNKEELAHQACIIFQAILRYMGDIPGRQTLLGLELTEVIFSGPLKQEILRDEVYCQIMKQLTDNPSPVSEEHGWQLMWLATGLFSCSQTLMKDLTQFLLSRRHHTSNDCMRKLKKTCQLGQRKCPPHRVEVEAIQHHTTQIFHKIYFPDDTNEAFTVKSSTRAKDLSEAISDRLHVKSPEGFSLFVKFAEKVVSIPEGDFFLDFIRNVDERIRKGKILPDGSNPVPSYQVFYMRKLWSHTVPGKDRKADIIFHFHQELPKLLRGYHQCSKEEAAILGALVYRANHAESRTDITAVIKSLIPCDLVKIQSNYEWKKDIIRAYNKDSGMSPDEAKVAFLKVLYRWPTYGSAFFEVSQTSDNNFPENLLVAINKQGISIIHIQSKELLANIPFSHIIHWLSSPTHFTITVGDSAAFSKLVLETSLAYKMDDLLTSYIAMVIASQDGSPKKKSESF